MTRKVLGSVFILAVLLGVGTVAVRTGKNSPMTPGRAGSTVDELLQGWNINPAERAKATPALARPLSSYRVNETAIVGGMDYCGAGYLARASESGFRFGSKTYSVELGAPVVRQGGATLECSTAEFVRPAFGVAELHRGAVIEKYVFENTRCEQFFSFPKAVGSGALEVRIPVTSELPGPIVTHRADEPGMKELQFVRGGLAFCDASGATRIAYHSAVVMDAAGTELALSPRFEGRDIVLDVPASFMNRAQYPVVIDPWFDLGGSASGGGISNNGGVSDRPAIAMTGAGLPFIAWSDNSAATAAEPDNYDIYMKFWNGFEFEQRDGSASSGGLSRNSGKSTNPSIALDGPLPTIAWQDNTGDGKIVSIFVKQLSTSGTWIERAGSASPGGISKSIGPCQHPSVGVVFQGGTIDPGDQRVPIVVYEDLSASSEIVCKIYWPGKLTNGAEEGWYWLRAQGNLVTSSALNFNTSSSLNGVDGGLGAGFSEYPYLVIDDVGRPVVAWQETRDGNYEIYLRRLEWGSNTRFTIVGSSAVGVLTPNGNWTGVAGSDAAGGISNTAGHSQYPSLAVDGDNLTVAWQELLPAAPPTANSQIYLRRSVGGGAWTGVAGSDTGGGLSQSTGSATTPSLAIGGSNMVVAWSDDLSGNPEIYARRFFLGTVVPARPPSTQWEQIGFQGSAAPLIGADTIAPATGVSKTASNSLLPKVAVDESGSPTIAWIDGANATFDVLLRQFAPNGPGTATGTAFTLVARQTETNPALGPAVDVAVGGTTTNTTVYFSARMFTENPPGSALRLEVEVKPQGAPFTGTPTPLPTTAVVPDTTIATPGNLSVVSFSGLPNTSYHWQYRSIDSEGRHSPWFPFGSVGNVSFIVNTNPPVIGPGGGPSTPPAIIVTSRSKSRCGLTGLEAIALLGALRLLRRRRSA